jgi:hypothetical protein
MRCSKPYGKLIRNSVDPTDYKTKILKFFPIRRSIMEDEPASSKTITIIILPIMIVGQFLIVIPKDGLSGYKPDSPYLKS